MNGIFHLCLVGVIGNPEVISLCIGKAAQPQSGENINHTGESDSELKLTDFKGKVVNQNAQF
jgi:hypothetical protein